MAAEALPEQPLIQPVHKDHGGAWSSPSPLTIIGFGFLTFNSAMSMAMSSCSTGLGAASFVGFSLLDLVMLFYCLRLYQKMPPESPLREDLKVAIWLLTVMLTIAFFQLLEFWFLMSIGATQNSIADFLNDTACPHQHPYPTAAP